PYPYRFAGGDGQTSQGVAAANLLEEAIRREGPDTVAGFLAEPVQGAGGVIVPQDDYFPRIRAICDKYDVLLISDEVITGFGRTGTWFGLEHWGIEPDIMQFAKGITSGYIPMGGIGVSDTIKAAMDNTPPDQRWMHAYTYSGHPTCCAVALANLTILEEEGLVQRAAEMGNRLLEGLHTLDDMPGVGEVRGLGMMAAVELVADKATKQEFPSTAKVGARVQREMNQRGLYTRARGDVICLAPPLVTTAEQIDRIGEVVGEAIPGAVRGAQGYYCVQLIAPASLAGWCAFQVLVGLRRACLDFDVGDAKRKGIRCYTGLKLQGEDEAKFSSFVCLTERRGIATGGEEWLRCSGDGHFASSRARDDKRI